MRQTGSPVLTQVKLCSSGEMPEATWTCRPAAVPVNLCGPAGRIPVLAGSSLERDSLASQLTCSSWDLPRPGSPTRST